MSRPRRRGRRGLVVVVLLVAAAGAAVAIWQGTRPAPAVATLVEPIERGPFVREVTGTGVIEPVQERALAFPNGGTVAAVAVAEGATVAAGDVLARLDTATLERERDSARASLASARADQQRLTAQQGVDRLDAQAAVANAEDQRARAARTLDDAERDAAVVARLLAAGAASRDEARAADAGVEAARRALDLAERSLETARSRLANLDQLAAAQRAAAAAQVAQLETTLANLEARLADTTIVAPFAGVVTAVNVDAGDLVGSQPVLTLADTASLRVRGRFDENRAAELALGQPADIVPDADTSRRLPATVDRISPVATREGGTAQVTAELGFDAGAALDPAVARPGSTVTVRVRVREMADALLVPLEAITEGAGGAYVFRVEPGETGGVARRVAVTVLERNPTVAAVEGPLGAGDLLALIALDALEDGAAVAFPPVAEGAGGD